MCLIFCQNIRQYIISWGKKYCSSLNYKEGWILELTAVSHTNTEWFLVNILGTTVICFPRLCTLRLRGTFILAQASRVNFLILQTVI